MDANTGKKFLPIKTIDGITVQVRIGQMREFFHDFLLEVYPERGPHGVVQIFGEDYFSLNKVKRIFRADAGIEVDFKDYEEWNCLMGKLLEIYNEEKRP
jgi:hypothetical protein